MPKDQSKVEKGPKKHNFPNKAEMPKGSVIVLKTVVRTCIRDGCGCDGDSVCDHSTLVLGLGGLRRGRVLSRGAFKGKHTKHTVKAFNSCTKCADRPGILHDRSSIKDLSDNM